MYITKCDACAAEIEKNGPALHFSYPRLFPAKVICEECAAPIMPFLRKLGLIKEKS